MKQSQQVLECQAEGEARGALKDRREALRTLLEDRFGVLPEVVVQKIESSEDLDRLKQAFRQALHLQQLADLQL
jgi:hypothetical protein